MSFSPIGACPIEGEPSDPRAETDPTEGEAGSGGGGAADPDDPSGNGGLGCGNSKVGPNPPDGNPVDLAHGDKLESATDLVVPITGPDFQVTRSYNSNPEYDAPDLSGNGWTINSLAFVKDLDPASDTLELAGMARSTIIVDVSGAGPTWPVPGSTSRIVTKAWIQIQDLHDSLQIPVWRVIEPGRWEMNFYRKNDSTEMDFNIWFEVVDGGSYEGLLLQQRDEYLNPWTYEYLLLDDPDIPEEPLPARLARISLNAGVSIRPEAEVRFIWDLANQIGALPYTNPNFGRLLEVQVVRFEEDENPREVVTQKVQYKYMDENATPSFSADLGVDGDLVQVVKHARVDPPPGAAEGTEDWRVQVTQYRYHRDTGGSDGAGNYMWSGNDHQLKMEIRPEQIEYAVQQANPTADPPVDLLAEAEKLLEEADGFEVYTGTLIVDLAARVIEEYENWDPADPDNNPGRVLTQYIQSACGCGGGGTQGKKRSYIYYDRAGDATVAETIEVTEEQLNLSTGLYDPYRTFFYEMIEPGTGSPPYLGIEAIRDNTGIVNPDTEWVTHYQYSQDERNLLAMFTPASVSNYVPGDDIVGPTLVLEPNDGLVHVFEYTDDNRRSKTQIKKGEPSFVGDICQDCILVTKTTYGSSDTGSERLHLPKKIERFQVAGTSDENEVETTHFEYGFHGPSDDDDDFAWIQTRVEAELLAENGPADPPTNPVFYYTHEFFDTSSRNYWSRAADNSLTRREFDTRTSLVTLVEKNADDVGFPVGQPGGLPPEVNFFGRYDADGGSLTTTYVRDLLGRVHESSTPGNVRTFTRREMRELDERPGIFYYAAVTLPHELNAGVEYNGPATITWLNADDDVIGSSDHELGVAYTFAQEPQEAYFQVISNYDLTTELARSRIEHDVSGLLTARKAWHAINAPSLPPYITSYTYDGLGRVVKTTNGLLTKTRNTYDVLDRAIKVEVGTDDSGAGSDNMLAVAHYVFDSTGDTQGVGNGNLTRLKEPIGMSGNDRVTDYTYDWRDRLIKMKNPLAPHEVIEYDNLDREVKRGVFSSFPGAVPYDFDLPDSSRKWLVETEYSQRGLVFRQGSAIDPELGDSPPRDTLATLTWFNEVGQTVASWGPNGPREKTSYDGLGRPETIYVSDGADATADFDDDFADVYDLLTHKAVVGDDVIIEQTDYQYILDTVFNELNVGQMDLVTVRYRTHDADDTKTGDLADFTPPDDDLVITTYAGTFYDNADRVIRSVNYGTTFDDEFKFGGIAPTIDQESPPFYNEGLGDWTGIGGELVSGTDHDTRGLVWRSITPDGEKTRNYYDDLNRRIAVFENFVNGTLAWDINKVPPRWVATGVGEATEKDDDRATSFVYDAINNITVQTAHQPLTGGADDQVTEYRYHNRFDPGQSEIATNDLLREVVYPDVEPTEDPADFTVFYAYNLQAELIFMEDQNATEHVYTRDDLGRVIQDKATIDPSGPIDDTFDTITTSYNDWGLVSTVNTLPKAPPNDPANGVAFAYNSIWQVTDVYQDLNSEAEFDGSGNPLNDTLRVQYTYSQSDIGSGNFSRYDTFKYPDGQFIAREYGASTSLDSRISRVRVVKELSVVPVEIHYATYDYIGLNMFAQVDHEPIDVQLDRTASHNGERQTQGRTDNPGLYPGFDRFGRVVKQIWVDGEFTTHDNDTTVPNMPSIVELRYTYDRDSNREAAYDDRVGAQQDFSHEYVYDDLDRLKEAKRGEWNGSTFSLRNGSQLWALDVLGNWSSIKTDDDGSGTYDSDEEDQRDHADPSDANELDQRTLIEQGMLGNDLELDLTYDKAGNLRTEERNVGVLSVPWTYTHDAWNRLVKVEALFTTKAEYEYNGLNWCIIKRSDTPGSATGLDQQRMRFYSATWQMCEERIDDDGPPPFPTSPTDPDIDRHVQYVAGVRYIDDCILQREDVGVDGEYENTRYYLSDVQYSTVAMLDTSATVLERLVYSAYGQADHQYGTDVDGDGDVDQDDVDAVNALLKKKIDDAGYDSAADMNRDGVIDRADEKIVSNDNPTSALAAGLISDPSIDNQIGWDGYVFNAETRQYAVRFRCYDPVLGRWLERDPVSYRAGMNLYEYAEARPIDLSDPIGLLPAGPGLGEVGRRLGRMGGIAIAGARAWWKSRRPKQPNCTNVEVWGNWNRTNQEFATKSSMTVPVGPNVLLALQELLDAAGLTAQGTTYLPWHELHTGNRLFNPSLEVIWGNGYLDASIASNNGARRFYACRCSFERDLFRVCVKCDANEDPKKYELLAGIPRRMRVGDAVPIASENKVTYGVIAFLPSEPGRGNIDKRVYCACPQPGTGPLGGYPLTEGQMKRSRHHSTIGPG